MSSRYAITFRLQPKEKQREQFAIFAGCGRFVWNECLRDQNLWYLAHGESLSVFDWAKNLTDVKAYYPWLKDCNAQVLQQRLRDLNKAWQKFFRQDQAGDGPPQPRCKEMHDTFRFPQGVKLAADKPYVFLPKIGWVKFRQSKDIKGTLKQATVRKKGQHWEATLTMEGEQKTEVEDVQTCGIDRGVTESIVTSKGDVHHWQSPAWIVDKIKAVQQKLSRQKRNSASRQATKRQLGRLKRRQANFRKDQIHKATTIISKNHARVAVEDLEVKDMTKSAKGSVEAPGKQVKAKAGLNREILDRGWGMFERFLEYKIEGRKGTFKKVNPAFTSQDCSCCGDRGQRKGKDFYCPVCGHEQDADLNAARNIEHKAFGTGHVLTEAASAV